MTDQTVQLNSPTDPREQLARAKEIYAAARRAGKSKAAAKQAAYDALPGFKEASGFGTSLGAPWARAIQAIELNLITAATTPPNGNGDHPTLFPGLSPSSDRAAAAYSPTDDICAYVEALDPKPGDVITLNLHYLAWHHKKVNDAAWRSAFTQGLPLRGWRFEVVNTNGRCYQLRVVARPQTEEQRQIAIMEAKLAELQQELARLRGK